MPQVIMHSLYAEILDITPLSLNARYRMALNSDHEQAQKHVQSIDKESFEKPLNTDAMLFLDINRAVEQAFSEVIVADKMYCQEGRLYIPSETLNSAQKRQLWALISE